MSKGMINSKPYIDFIQIIIKTFNICNISLKVVKYYFNNIQDICRFNYVEFCL